MPQDVIVPGSGPAPLQGGAPTPPVSPAPPERAVEPGSLLVPEPGAEEAGAGKPGEQPAPRPPVFEPKFPEGTLVDETAMAAVRESVASGDLKPEAAQRLLDQHMDAMRRYDECRSAEAIRTVEGWEREIQSHPEFGGARLRENAEAAKLMLHRYGSPRLVEEFRTMGVLSHPEFAYMLMRMSRDLSDGRSLSGAAQATPEVSAAAALYPTMAGEGK